MAATKIFEDLESEVRSYCRTFPVVFDRAQGVHLYDTDGNRYLDFLAGAGALNYGHNHPVLKEKLLEYIGRDGITHALDLHSDAKAAFLEALQRVIFEPRGMRYKVQFTGPTGTNAVEAAFKLARKVTGRHTVVSFTHGFHGVTLGSLAATGNRSKRKGAHVPLSNTAFMPYDGAYGPEVDSIEVLEHTLADNSGGLDMPAAVIFEPVQGEGGLNAASFEWMQRLEACCRRYGVLLIADDIQAGCGRTGTFFSFEPAGIEPDMITVSKSLSGYGTPLAVTLIKPEHDQWAPGEHIGTFRGNNQAFVTATAALEYFWSDDAFAEEVRAKAEIITEHLDGTVQKHDGLYRKGRGIMQGVACPSGEMAEAVQEKCFEQGLIIETSGADDEVVKVFAPLVITEEELRRGLEIIDSAVDAVADKHMRKVS